MVLTEDELERSETKSAKVTAELNSASDRADKITKAIKTLETKNMIDETRKKNARVVENSGILNIIYTCLDFHVSRN